MTISTGKQDPTVTAHTATKSLHTSSAARSANASAVLAYVGPYFLFGLVLWMEGQLPQPWASYFLPLRGLAPLALFAHCYSRGAYAELRNLQWSLKCVSLDIAVGLFVTLLWTAPYVYGWLAAPGPKQAFDPNAAGKDFAPFLLAARLFGFAFVTPIFEELFIRSFLHRFVDVYNDRHADFRNVPIGQFTWAGFVVTVAFFTFTHAGWEGPVAAATCVIYNALLYARKTILAPIVAHAVTNFSLFMLVVMTSGSVTGPDGRLLDLWYFL